MTSLYDGIQTCSPEILAIATQIIRDRDHRADCGRESSSVSSENLSRHEETLDQQIQIARAKLEHLAEHVLSDVAAEILAQSDLDPQDSISQLQQGSDENNLTYFLRTAILLDSILAKANIGPDSDSEAVIPAALAKFSVLDGFVEGIYDEDIRDQVMEGVLTTDPHCSLIHLYQALESATARKRHTEAAHGQEDLTSDPQATTLADKVRNTDGPSRSTNIEPEDDGSRDSGDAVR